MNNTKYFRALVNESIGRLNFPAEPAELYEPITYILALGGKRMRPVLLLMACELFGGEAHTAIPPALAIEVFHNFTLVHDDIMDKAPLRRGKTTVHERWNQNIAILSGDVMMVEAYKLIIQVDVSILKEVLNVFNNTAVGVCEGQQWDMNFETRQQVSVEEYLNMIRLKTAVLLGCALKVGALIGGASAQDAELLCRFGEHLGIAFQLQDDILDVYGDPEKFGKQVGGDIISNKKTFLLIKALELAQGKTASDLSFWLAAAQFEPAEKVDAVTNIYNQLNIRQQAQNAMQECYDAAMEALAAVNLSADRKQYLHDFADSLLIREN